MKPHDPRPTQRATAAAARTILRARLGWLRGFPHGTRGALAWCVVPGPDDGEPIRRTTIDGQSLHQATYAVKHLTGRFPRVLPKLVGPVAAWRESVERRLTILKETLHRQAALPSVEPLASALGLPPATARALGGIEADDPALGALVRALLWIHGGDRCKLARVCREVLARREALGTILARVGDERGNELAILLLDWIAAGKTGASECLDVLGDPGSWAAGMQAVEHLRSLGAKLDACLDPPAPPASRLPQELVKLCLEHAADPAQRDTFLAVAGAVLPGAEHRRRWSSWWSDVGRLADKIRGAKRRWREGAVPPADLALFHKELARLRAARPPESQWNVRGLLGTVQPLTGRGPELWPALAVVLRSLPEVHHDALPRIALIEALGWHPFETREPFDLLTPALRGLASLLRPGPAAAQTAASGAWLTAIALPALVEELSEGGWSASRLKVALEALGLMLPQVAAWPGGPEVLGDGTLCRVLLRAVHATGNPAEAVAFTRALVEEARTAQLILRRTPQRAVLDAALAISHDAPDLFVSLVQLLLGWKEPALALLRELANDPARQPILRALMAGGEVERIGRLLERGLLLRGLGGAHAFTRALDRASGGGRVPPGYLDRYPPALHELLASLARIDPEAPRAADRILGRDFPDRARLHEELAALGRLLEESTARDQGPLRARQANLAARLNDQPTPVAGARLDRYREKLRQRIQRATLEAWEAAIDGALREQLTPALGVEPPAAWWRDPYLRVLSGVCRLEPRFRKLGLRLLRGFLGAPAWNPHEEPANRRFLERMTRRGLDLAPWLDDPAPLVRGGITLAIERAPLEILRMGDHFGTCLSSHSFNFFSAVANAVDVNKRVLYARDRRGGVVGRCLLGLTAQGAILTFQPYAHDAKLDFPAMVREFVVLLAQRMKTRAAPDGTVETLVAPAWYDDGARDLTGRFAFLEGESAFLRALPTITPEGLAVALDEALGVGGLDALSLPRLLALRELDARPELVLALLPRLEDPDVPAEARQRAAALAFKAGDRAAASRIRRELCRPAALRALLPRSRLELARELVESGLAPLALRILREHEPELESRHRLEATARAVAGRAYEALGRPRQALDHYRAALGDDYLPDRDLCRARVAALEEELGS